MSNFSLSHNVFKSCLLLMCQNEYIWGKGLRNNTEINSLYLCEDDKLLFLLQVKLVGKFYYVYIMFHRFCLWKRETIQGLSILYKFFMVFCHTVINSKHGNQYEHVVHVFVFLTHSHTMTPFDAPGKQAFWKHYGKRRNCSQWAISPFPTVFSTCWIAFCHFRQIWNCRLQTLSVWKSLKYVGW